MAMWSINGLELELDISEADTAERYEMAVEQLAKDIPASTVKGIKFSTFIHAYCNAHRKLYDTLFGSGTSEKIFADIPESIRKYNAVYAKLLAFVAEQAKTAYNDITEVQKKYEPEIKTGA